MTYTASGWCVYRPWGWVPFFSYTYRIMNTSVFRFCYTLPASASTFTAMQEIHWHSLMVRRIPSISWDLFDNLDQKLSYILRTEPNVKKKNLTLIEIISSNGLCYWVLQLLFYINIFPNSSEEELPFYLSRNINAKRKSRMAYFFFYKDKEEKTRRKK